MEESGSLREMSDFEMAIQMGKAVVDPDDEGSENGIGLFPESESEGEGESEGEEGESNVKKKKKTKKKRK